LWEGGPKGSVEYEGVAAASVEEVVLDWSWLSIQNVSLSSSSVAWLLLNKRIPEALFLSHRRRREKEETKPLLLRIENDILVMVACLFRMTVEMIRIVSP